MLSAWNPDVDDAERGARIAAISTGDKPTMDPATLAWINAGSQVLGKVLTPTPAGPSHADSGGYNLFDNSGFAVSFAGDAAGPNARGGSAAASATGGLNPWLIGGGMLAAFLAFAVWSKRH